VIHISEGVSLYKRVVDVPSQLRLIFKHVQTCSSDGDHRQPRNFLNLSSVDLVLVEPRTPQTSCWSFEVHFDLLDPLFGTEGRNVG